MVVGPAPAVTGFAPRAGPPGTVLTIRGRGFGTTPGLVTLCQFCGTGAQISARAHILSWEDDQVQAEIPAAFQSGGATVHLATAADQVVTVGVFDVAAGPAPGTTAPLG